MSKQLIAQEIHSLTELIHEQRQKVLAHEGRIPAIELDLLMGNVRNLYERLLLLQKVNDAPVEVQFTEQPVAVQQKPEPPVVVVAPVQVERVAEHLETVPEVVIEIAEAEVAPVVTELVAAPERVVVAQVVEEQSITSKERSREFSRSGKSVAAATLFDDTPTVGDKFHAAPSVHDKLSAGTHDRSVAVKLSRNPVEDLKKSIGINEKFSFINELFNGDMNHYSEAIDNLNKCSGAGEAAGLLTALASEHSWNADNESFVKLRDLVSRRFS